MRVVTFTPFAVALLLTAPPRALEAQFRADPGVEVNGKVYVVAYVTLSDAQQPYHPVTEYELVLYGPRRDSLVARTDQVGIAKFLAAPGSYRLVARTAHEWQGSRYRWSVPVQVRSGMAAVDLTRENAQVVGPGPATAAEARAGTDPRAMTEPRAAAGRPAAPEGGPATVPMLTPKDGGVAVLISFLITGGGQMYAGRTGKGVGLLLGAIGAAVTGAAITSGSCGSGSGLVYDNDCEVGPLVAGVATSVVLWVYSMASAPGDVRAWNAARGIRTARATPVLRQRGPATQAGVAVAW
jgi:hypothetical protein